MSSSAFSFYFLKNLDNSEAVRDFLLCCEIYDF